MKLSKIVLSTVMVLFMSSAYTEAKISKKIKRACKGDYKKFCPRYKIGTKKMRLCMRSNRNVISWRCYSTLKDAGYGDRRNRRR
jgi:hypothetical protein